MNRIENVMPIKQKVMKLFGAIASMQLVKVTESAIVEICSSNFKGKAAVSMDIM
jgi:hypothetical protein